MEKDHAFSASEIMDSLSGMVTKAQAAAISEGKFGNPKFIASARPNANVKETLSYVSGIGAGQVLADVTDKIYRIFNPERSPAGSKHRIVVLGEEGNTLPVKISGRISDAIDAAPFERGDTVEIRGILTAPDGTGSVIPNGTITKIKPTGMLSVSDYSVIVSSVQGVDIMGVITEIGPIRHISGLGGKRPVPVASCVMSDGKTNATASFWGSSALATAEIRANSYVKLEFCNIRVLEGKIMINATDTTRVLAHASIGQMMSQRSP